MEKTYSNQTQEQTIVCAPPCLVLFDPQSNQFFSVAVEIDPSWEMIEVLRG